MTATTHEHTSFKAGCAECQLRDRTRSRQRRMAIAQGYWSNELVDADPVRQHLGALCPPMAVERVADLAGVSSKGLHQVLQNPTRRVMRFTAEAVLAVQPRRPYTVSAIPTARRLRALGCDGWDRVTLSRHTGLTAGFLRHLRVMTSPRVRATTHDTVAQTYRQLEGYAGPSERLRQSAAKRLGWYPAEAWDEITIDLDGAQPYQHIPPECGDWVVVQKILHNPGLFHLANPAEQDELYQRHLAGGGSEYGFRKLYKPQSGAMPAILYRRCRAAAGAVAS